VQLPAEPHDTELIGVLWLVDASLGRVAATADQELEDSLSRRPSCVNPAPVVYWPPALQSPADGHDTELRATCGSEAGAGLLGSITSVAVHAPPDWLSSNPCVLLLPVLSLYEPTAAQLPGDAHETELTMVPLKLAALPGVGAFTPVAQLPPDSLSNKHAWELPSYRRFRQ
jgi:hypothetical protein